MSLELHLTPAIPRTVCIVVGKAEHSGNTDLATQLERVPQQLSHRKELRVDCLACPCLSKWLLPFVVSSD